MASRAAAKDTRRVGRNEPQEVGRQWEAMAKNLVAQVGKAGGEFELVEREIPAPGPGEVRIKVKACGICFSDIKILNLGPDHPRLSVR